MKAIIFGCSGQDGRYLSELLEGLGYTVIGVDRAGKFNSVDLTDFGKVASFINEYQPHYIFHFAADSTTKHTAWKSNHDTISTGALNILEAVYQYSNKSKVFLAGSGLQFKNEGKPIKETDPFDASSIYSVSRIHTVYTARYYRQLGVKVYIGYFFNHDSPFRSERHINKLIVNTVNRIAKGSDEKLEIGNLDVKKEFGFAGDIVKAVWILVNQDDIHEAVIGTGKAYSLKDWVDTCFSIRGLSWQNHVILKPGFVADYDLLVSDPSKIISIGWHPEVDITSLAKMMMDEI